MDKSEKKGPVAGAAVAYTHGGGDVFWTCSADPRLDISFKVFHTGDGKAAQIAYGTRPSAVQVDFGHDSIDGHLLWWEFTCRAAGGHAGSWPVFVQFFQGTREKGYEAVSRVIRYDVSVAPNRPAGAMDHVTFRAFTGARIAA